MFEVVRSLISAQQPENERWWTFMLFLPAQYLLMTGEPDHRMWRTRRHVGQSGALIKTEIHLLLLPGFVKLWITAISVSVRSFVFVNIYLKPHARVIIFPSHCFLELFVSLWVCVFVNKYTYMYFCMSVRHFLAQMVSLCTETCGCPRPETCKDLWISGASCDRTHWLHTPTAPPIVSAWTPTSILNSLDA